MKANRRKKIVAWVNLYPNGNTGAVNPSRAAAMRVSCEGVLETIKLVEHDAKREAIIRQIIEHTSHIGREPELRRALIALYNHEKGTK